MGLFADGEIPRVNKSPLAESVDADVETVERRVFARHGIKF